VGEGFVVLAQAGWCWLVIMVVAGGRFTVVINARFHAAD